MIETLLLLFGIALLWAALYLGLPLWAWTSAAIFAGIAASMVSASAVLAALLLPTALLLFFSLPPLRRALVTRGVLTAFKKTLPEMSSTEREAIEAGDVWWEAQMFRGRPRWEQLLDFQYTPLTERERSFLDVECETLCSMVDDWKVEFEDRDLTPAVWQYIKQQGFLAMLIPKAHGGLGFSAAAQSAVVTKLASRSITLAVTVMVPNSLGPGELLMHYGTDAQKQRWLPALASGEEIPCFGLTGPEVGSDATAMPDTGVVCLGLHQGQEIVGIRLNFTKRWITLAPVATVIGLAFKLSDPDGLLGDPLRTDYGITCALIPATHPGVDNGRRHYPGAAFMNGPVFGRDVFIPVDWIIGGPAMAGRGWRMLVECLSAGRGISLPALATAAGQVCYRVVGAYASIRRQFRTHIGKFEGVQEATGRIAGLTYSLEAMRVLTASAVDHCAPSVVTAIAKYHMTEMMRCAVTDAMDVMGGRGIQQGPRNPLATAWKCVPIAITVEGANILARNLMIFGQGAIRCHEYVLPEMEAARAGNLAEFDRLLFGHIGFSINRAVRALTLGLCGARLARSPLPGPMAPYFRQMERMSASLAIVSDITMATLGGELKRRERLSARLGDVLSQLYIASAVAKYFVSNGQPPEELDHARWALDESLYRMGQAFDAFFDNFPNRPVAWLMRRLVFPWGNPYRPVADALNGRVAERIMQDAPLRDRLTALVFGDQGGQGPIQRIEQAFVQLQRVAPVYGQFLKAVSSGRIQGQNIAEQLADAQAQGLLSDAQATDIARYDELRYDAILTDHFASLHPGG